MALLADHEADQSVSSDLDVVVFEPDDPLAYPRSIGRLHSAGGALIIDPYLSLTDIRRLIVSTNVTRILVLNKPHRDSAIEELGTYVDG